MDDSPYIRFAIDQLTRDEELLGRSRRPTESEDSYPVRRASLGDRSVLPPTQSSPQAQPEARVAAPASRPLDPYRKLNQIVVGPRWLTPAAPTDFLLPALPPQDFFRYPALNYKPTLIKLLPLCVLIFFCLSMIAALVVCSVWSSQHNGLLQYDGVGTSRYFLFEFLPQLLAGAIVLWVLLVQTTVYRILPFSVLASSRSPRRSQVLNSFALFPTNYLAPNVSCFKNREYLVGTSFLAFWLCLFTIPLQSCLFQTRLFPGANQEVWNWATAQPIAWILIALYALLVVALVLLVIRFARWETGLKWDTVSLADIFALLYRSNILSYFEGSEIRANLQRHYEPGNSRLGYWSTSQKPDRIFYGIGEESTAVRRYSLEKGKLRVKGPEDKEADPASMDLESQRPVKVETLESLQTNVHSPGVRYRWSPWFLRESFVVAWIVIALVLMLAFVIVSFVHQAVQVGFLPLLPAPTTGLAFSPADFLYSFLPSLIGLILFLCWQSIDAYFRALQPFANLANTRGTSAEHSLLLNYSACLPIEVTIKAALNGDFKVAWISFISLLSLVLPILGGGLFTAQFFADKQQVRIAACMPAYYALVVFVVIYALSFLLLWPSWKRRLPHDIRTLGDIISFVYQSPILADAAFHEPRSKIDLVTRLVSYPPGEKTSPRYAFGVFVGRDGREHLGIDRFQRLGQGEMIVTTGGRR